MDNKTSAYDPEKHKGRTFHDVRVAFADCSDTPIAYLERCFDEVTVREPILKALSSLNEDASHTAAEASTKRWKDGRPLSNIDGMPIGIKDLLEAKDMPTQMGCDSWQRHDACCNWYAGWRLDYTASSVLR